MRRCRPESSGSAECISEEKPSLVVVHHDPSAAGDLLDELQRSGGDMATASLAPCKETQSLIPVAADIVVICLGHPSGDALTFAAQAAVERPWIEIVFVADDCGASSELQAARCLGIARIVPRTQLVPWLSTAAALLSRCARGRRHLLEAQAAVPPPPTCDAGVFGMALALRQSEQQFRESYLRAVLSRSRSQKEAATLAGVPYTTLCSMMKKLGIEPEPASSHVERRESSSAKSRVPSAW